MWVCVGRAVSLPFCECRKCARILRLMWSIKSRSSVSALASSYPPIRANIWPTASHSSGSKCWNLAFAVVGPLREPRKICYSFRRFKGVGLIAFRSSFVSALSQPNHSPLSWFVFPASLAQKMGGFSAGSKGNWINIWQVGEWMPTNLLWGTDSSKLRDESGCEKSMHECDFQHIFHINCQQLGMSTASSVILYAQSAGRTTNQHHPTNPPTITSGWCASVSSESVGYMCLYWVDPCPTAVSYK